jgi:hypothetical protein
MFEGVNKKGVAIRVERVFNPCFLIKHKKNMWQSVVRGVNELIISNQNARNHF